MKKLIIATRGSELAIWQSNYVKEVLEAHHPELEVELKPVVTQGDKILDKPLALIGGKGLFTKEVEDLMLSGEAHFAVHSLKDMPTIVHPDLQLVAITKRADSRDALLSEKYENLDALPKGAVIGTTSLRRRMELLKLRPDLVMKELRGNVNTRIKKMQDGEFDAIILAAAGISRLGFENKVKYYSEIPLDNMIPSMGQGALAIEAVKHDKVIELLSILEDDKTRIEATIERDFVGKLEGSCTVPIGIHAEVQDDEIFVQAILGTPDGKEYLHDTIRINKDAYQDAGKNFADDFIKKGALPLLKKAEELAFK